MKAIDKHSWERLADTEYKTKNWKCSKCGCHKSLGNYKFATPSYERSGINTQDRPSCVDMSRRVEFTVD